MPNLVGIGLSQVPTNSMLGGLAYQDPEHASIKDLDLKNLSQINSEIADTAGDVFVYDTRKDSDGGAWRKRTQHTSWYNETLGTATRGTRKEFPAVAVIVATSSGVTIYDGDDPDLPMWMVFEDTVSDMINTHNVNPNSFSLSALNANVLIGSHHPSYGEANVINFISDNGVSYYSAHSGDYRGSISQRNDGLSQTINSNYGTLVNSVVNDVAMTVLPNAPIDDTTGLPIPTIAVGTDGGPSIIKDDGTVVDLTYQEATNRIVRMIDIDSNGRIYWSTRETGSAPGVYFHEADLPAADSSSEPPVNIATNQAGAVNGVKPTLISGSLRDVIRTKDRTVLSLSGYDNKGHLNLYNVTGDVNSSGSVDNFEMVDISTDYNTGYIIGDIKGAFLSDTDDTNVSASTNLVTNGTFDSNNDSWNGSGISLLHNSFTTSQSSGYLIVNSNTNSSSYYGISQDVTTTTGKEYMLSFDIVSGGTGNGAVRVSDGNTATNVLSTVSGLGVGSHSFRFVSGSQSFSKVFLGRDASTNSGTNRTVYYDNIVVREATEADRSVNNKGLQVFGTVPKQVVATGADLVSYGPFNNNNNFRQPHNSDLNFEQNDFSIMFWVYDTGVNQHCTLVSRDEREFDISRLTSGKLRIYTRNSSEVLRAPDSSSNLPQNSWTCVCVVYTGGNTKRVYIDGVLDRMITGADGEYDIDSTTYGLNIGVRYTGGTKNYSADGVQLALMRISGSAPLPEQIKKIYEDEKHLFQENAKATLYGSPDNVTAIAYDDSTNILYAGTAVGRSEFQGLRRINNTTTAVTTAISASNGLVAEQ